MSLLDHYNSLKRDFKVTSRQQSANERFPLRVSAWVIAVFESRLDKFEDFDEALRSALRYFEKKPTTPDGDTISPMTQEDLLDILEWYNELNESKVQQLELLLESIRAEHVRDYLSQRQDKASATYDDYIKWLSTQRIPADQAVSKVWFNRNKSAHFIKAPKEPRTPPRKKKFTVEDQIEVERIIKQQGLKPEVFYGEEYAIELSSYTDRGSIRYVLEGSVETGDRGPRTDHGGGVDGEGWMDSRQIAHYAEPYKRKWQPKVEALQARLRKEGYPTAEVHTDYGEKGHIRLVVYIEMIVEN